MGSQYSKEWKQDLFTVKWKGYSEKADWTKEFYENFDNRILLKEYHKWNPQTIKDNWMKQLS